MHRKSHWNRVYAKKASDELSWYQAEPTTSLRLLDAAGMTAASRVIDVGGGDSRLVDRLVERGLTRVVVVDVSEAALSRAKARLGTAQDRVEWIEADVTGDWTAPDVDIWHDRAVFHFLAEPEDRRAYLGHLRRALKPGGAAVIATFALDGPDTCSGLPVVRYSPDTLGSELGPGFRLVESKADLHLTPAGKTQSFCYARFVRTI